MPLLNAPFRFMAVLAACALGPSVVHAACASPSGVEGEQVYNTTFKVMQFCNGTNWISMAGTNVSGAWAPSGTALYYNGGNVGIGTSSPVRTLELTDTSSIVRLTDSDSTGDSVVAYIEFNGSNGVRTGYLGDGSSGNGNLYLTSDGGNFTVAGIGGTCTVNTGGCTSDERLKMNIHPIGLSLEKMSKLNGVSYEWKKHPGKPYYGVIAQNVETQFPELVEEGDDGFKSVNYRGLVAPMIEAIKELKAENDTLRADVEALKKAAGQSPQ